MKNLLIAGIAAGIAFTAAPAMAANDSLTTSVVPIAADEFLGAADFQKGRMPKVMGGHGPRPMPGGMGHGPRPMPGGMGHGPRPMPTLGHGPRPMPTVGHGPRGGHAGMHHNRWGNRINGRWAGGYHAPGGWMGYRRPSRGFILPSYWINPGYSISNFSSYGLYAPTAGFGWSRYYDDVVLRDSRGYVQDYRSGIDWDRSDRGYAPNSGYGQVSYAQPTYSQPTYSQPVYAPNIAADAQVYDVDGEYDDGDVEYAEGTGAPYPAPAAQGGFYQPQRAPSYAPAEPAYSAPYGYERYERCLRERGVGGGVIGSVIGAVAGNRIAGRGDRLAGSLIGGGLGALAGMGIEKATNKCRRYLPEQTGYSAPQPQYRQPEPRYEAPAPQYAPAPQAYPQGGYVSNGYYYPPMPAPTMTTVTVTPAVTTTTTVTETEEVYYETAAVRRKPAMRKYRPRARAKPRCHCH